jgi:uncharacterized protein with GYD domain
MATYINLLHFTQQGIADIRESPGRIESARKLYEQMGAKVKDFYCVMGQYDTVLIAEAPDDETMAKIQLALGSLGNVRSETLRAFTEAEYRKIVAALP